MEQLLIEIDYKQSLASRILGVEQADVNLVRSQLEIGTQHTVVEQQLYVVVLLVLLGSTTLNVPVFARLLLHQQSHVVGHKVNTSLQT